MNEYEYVADKIDLEKYLKQLWKRVWVLIIGLVLGAVIAVSIAWFFVTPVYDSTVMLYVNNRTGGDGEYYSSAELSAAKSLVDTYIVILEQRPTLQTVIDNLGLPYSYEELKKMVSAEAENNTEIFSITVRAEDPYEANKIVNAIAEVLPQTIADVVDGASVEIVDSGTVNTSQAAPSYKRYFVRGALVGLICAALLVIIQYVLDKKVHDEEFTNELPVAIPVLASIPDLSSGNGTDGGKHDSGGKKRGSSGKKNKKRSAAQIVRGLTYDKLDFFAVEAYKLLKTNIMYTLADLEECKVIGITSAVQGETKTTTAINIARSFAQAGKKVLLIEGDMRRPVIAKRLKIHSSFGLSGVLGGFCNLNETLNNCDPNQNLYVITAGEIPPNPAELLESKRMKEMVNALRNYYECIIVDLPPVNSVTDVLAAAPNLDGVVMVVRQGYTDIRDLTAAVQQLNFTHVNILGCVLTDVVHNKNDGYYKGKNKYSYRYEEKKA